MELYVALREAMTRAGWPLERVAFESGVSSDAVRKWLAGSSQPRRVAYDLLRRKLPGFAEMVDREVARAS